MHKSRMKVSNINNNLKVNKIKVPKSLNESDMHPLIKSGWKTFNSRKTDDYNCVTLRRHNRLDIRATKQNGKRAFRIMNAILKAIEKNGLKIELTDKNRKFNQEEMDTCILINDEVIRIRLEETVKRIKMPPAKDAIEYSWGYFHTYNYVPSNVFSLYLDDCGYYFMPEKTWRDGKNPLENRLDNFFEALHTVVEGIKIKRKERAEQAERDRIAAEARAKLRQQKEAELAKVDKLESHMENWRKSQDIRSYIKEVKTKINTGNNNEMREFLEWAEKYAEHIDPTTEKRISILDNDEV